MPNPGQRFRVADVPDVVTRQVVQSLADAAARVTQAAAQASTLAYVEGTYVPTDGSGAGLALTVNAATYTKIGRRVSGLLYVVYPATASGAIAQVNLNTPYASAATSAAVVFSNGGGGVIVAQIGGSVLNFYAVGAVGITNANLSGAFVIVPWSFDV